WWKQEGGYVVPVLSTVLAVTPKQDRIEAEDEQGDVIRDVSPGSIEHHTSSPKTDQKPGKETGPGRSKGSGRKGATGRSKPPGQRVVGSGRRSRPQRDEAREERITMEIVVDAYDKDERAMGWYYYLQEKLEVPFLARCIEEREVSPLSVGDEVEVVGMP